MSIMNNIREFLFYAAEGALGVIAPRPQIKNDNDNNDNNNDDDDEDDYYNNNNNNNNNDKW